MKEATLNKPVTELAPDIAEGFLPGSGRLVFSRVGKKTVVTEMMARSPLRLLNPGNHGTGAWVYTSSFGGGLLGGDRYDINIRIEEKAMAFLTTQASTKIYKNDLQAEQALRADIEKDGILFCIPDPVVCYANSAYVQDQDFLLNSSSALVVVDGFTSGRKEFGESWDFRSYRSRMRIRRNGTLIFQDTIRLEPRHGSLAERFGRFSCFAFAVVVGEAFKTVCRKVLRDTHCEPLTRKSSLYETCSPLDGEGLVLRVGGTSEEEVKLALYSRLKFIKVFLGDDPTIR